MRALRLLGVLLAFALVAAACGDDDVVDTTTTTVAPTPGLTQTEGVLTVGSDIPFPPFEFYDDAGDLTGYDVELVEEMAARLGLTVTWIETDFDTIFTQLATGRFDLVASATTITAERAAMVNFTIPYYRAEQALTVNTGLTPNIRSVDTLSPGDRVAVQSGTTGEDWALENLAPLGIEVVSFPEAADTYIALEGGVVEAVVFDEPSAVVESEARPGLEVVEVITTGEEYGFGVDPDRPPLLAELNRVLGEMMADGTYQAIYDTWFPEAPAGSVLYDPRAGWPDRLVFGFVPSREAEELQDNVDLLAQILADALDIDVEGIVTPDYTALGVAMGTGSVQLGALPPAGYVLASRTYPNIELLAQSVRFGSATYHAQFFTNDPSICTGDPVEGAFTHAEDGRTVIRVGPTDTPAQQVGWLADDTRDPEVEAGLVCPEPVALTAEVISGRTIAFVGETSTSGYIFPTVQLIGAGFTEGEDYTPLFAGSHDGAVVAVYNGDADIGVSFDDARRNIRATNPDVGQVVIVFNITAPIANDVIGIDANLPESFKDAVFNALAAFIATEEGREVMDDIYSWTDLTRADDFTRASFALIEEAIDLLGFGQ